jgi:hypothetical protein
MLCTTEQIKSLYWYRRVSTYISLWWYMGANQMLYLMIDLGKWCLFLLPCMIMVFGNESNRSNFICFILISLFSQKSQSSTPRFPVQFIIRFRVLMYRLSLGCIWEIILSRIISIGMMTVCYSMADNPTNITIQTFSISHRRSDCMAGLVAVACLILACCFKKQSG